MRLKTLWVCLVVVACGGSTGSNHGGETHWLASCTASTECGGDLGCACGVCTRPCSVDADCGNLGADAVCSDAANTEFQNDCSSSELQQRFCVAEGSLGSGGSAGIGGSSGADSGGSSGAGASSGSGGGGGVSGGGSLEDDASHVCEDVPDACDSGTCFAVCGVNIAIVDAPQTLGFASEPQPAAYGAVTEIGSLKLAARGSRWLVTEGDSSEPTGELVYPGLSGPVVAGDRAFLFDSFGNLLPLNLDDPAAPAIDERWAPEVDLSNPESPAPRARLRGTSRGELVFEVGHSVSFVDVSGASPQEVACVELMQPLGEEGWYDLVHVTDDSIVQLTADESEYRWRYSIYDRDGDGEVVDTLEARWESPSLFWQDRMAVYADTATPSVALYELSAEGANELATADFPEGASPSTWSSGVFAGLMVFEDACDSSSCPAFDMVSEPPLAAYSVDAALFTPEVCTAAVTSTGSDPDFWLAPRISPNERITSVPGIDCGTTDHVSWGAQAMAWSPSGDELALYSYANDTPWLRIWEPGSDEALTLTPGADEDYFLDTLWWTDDIVIGHAGIDCDSRRDWLYLHDLNAPDSAPLRLDFPGPMLGMDVDAGRIWALGLDGPYDCALGLEEPPKVAWFLDVVDSEAGFTPVDLPEGADPEQIQFAAGRVYLVSPNRIDVLDVDGEPLEVVDYTSPYRPATAASALGLFVRDPERLQYLPPGDDTLASEAQSCSERFPVAADADSLYLSSRVPGGLHQVTAGELTRVSVARSGDTLDLEVTARLPWGGALTVIASDQGVVAASLPREVLILD